MTVTTDMSNGVPQESVLGPTSFLIFINDLAKSICNLCYLFADDVKVDVDVKEKIEAVKAWSNK